MLIRAAPAGAYTAASLGVAWRPDPRTLTRIRAVVPTLPTYVAPLPPAAAPTLAPNACFLKEGRCTGKCGGSVELGFGACFVAARRLDTSPP